MSEAGGLGSLGAAYLTPRQIAAAGTAVRARTNRPFAVNLFIPEPLPDVSESEVEAAVAELAPLHVELDLPPPTLPGRVREDFAAQFRVVLDLRPAAFSFVFGRLGAVELAALRERASSPSARRPGWRRPARSRRTGWTRWSRRGRGGGHRGGWGHDELADTLSLTRAVVGAVQVPVIAAGGLMDAAGVRAALGAGASLAQCGTVFLRAAEAGTSAPYRTALAAAGPGDTTLTRAFSGRAARGLANRVTAEVERPLPYPFQNALTREMRSAATRAGRPEFLSLWAGEGVHLAWDGTAAEILESLWP